MKSKIKYLIVIILLLFISGGLITFAMFRLYKNASGNVSAARWNVSFKNGSTTLTNNFNINLANATWTNPFGTVATGKIAPGSETTFNLTIDASGTETDVEYRVELGNSNLTDFEISVNDDNSTIYYSTNGSMVKSIPITVKWLGSMSDDAAKKARDNSQTSSTLNIPIVVTATQKLPLYLGKIVYYDPVSTSRCDETTFNLNNVKNGTSTCYKWRVIDTNLNNDDINIQMDHNLINTVAWNTTGNNDEGPVTILSSLATATSSWTRVRNLNFTYDTSASTSNYGTLSCTNGTCTISKTNEQINNVKARIITGEEVISIIQTETDGTTIADSWSLSNNIASKTITFSNMNYLIGTRTRSDGLGSTKLSWLIENTSINSSEPSGATNNIYGNISNAGYWTLSPSLSQLYVSYVSRVGSFSPRNELNLSRGEGARPVIKVSKSDLN